MKLSIIFILATFILGQEAWAKDQPEGALTYLGEIPTEAPNLTKSPLLEKVDRDLILYQRRKETARLVSDVINGKATVRPSMIPLEIFDRIYLVEKRTQALMEVQSGDAKAMFYLGQWVAMRDMLYIAGLLPEVFHYQLTLSSGGLLSEGADRMRLITAMLLLLNYKESNPISPGDIVQITSPQSQ